MMNKRLITIAGAAMFSAALSAQARDVSTARGATGVGAEMPRVSGELVPFPGGFKAIVESAPIAVRPDLEIVSGVAGRMGVPNGERHISNLLQRMADEKSKTGAVSRAYAKELARAGDSAVGAEATAVQRLSVGAMKLLGSVEGDEAYELIRLGMETARAKEHKVIMINGIAKVIEAAQHDLDTMPKAANDNDIIAGAIKKTTTDHLTSVAALKAALVEKCDPSLKAVGQN